VAGQLVLTVLDDGRGLPSPPERGDGLGLRIMAHRAAMIRADFTIENQPDGGALLTCRFPA
jgi:signal transduction histidine kinase